VLTGKQEVFTNFLYKVLQKAFIWNLIFGVVTAVKMSLSFSIF
jgi:hypothetical protein